jgi:hypothetical protein
MNKLPQGAETNPSHLSLVDFFFRKLRLDCALNSVRSGTFNFELLDLFIDRIEARTRLMWNEVNDRGVEPHTHAPGVIAIGYRLLGLGFSLVTGESRVA